MVVISPDGLNAVYITFSRDDNTVFIYTFLGSKDLKKLQLFFYLVLFTLLMAVFVL